MSDGIKTGVVDVGGGFRGIYATGVFDRCLDEGVSFDLGIGVSAGSANLMSFIAHQYHRNYTFYVQYGRRREYSGIYEFLTSGNFFNLDYVYGTLSNEGGENPVDYDAFVANPMDYLVVAADARSGKPHYFRKDEIKRNNYDILKASSAIPGLCKPYFVEGIPYFDGALGDPVPVEKAFEEGCEKVVVILTKPVDVLRTADSDIRLAKLIERDYPLAAKALCNRAMLYNVGVGVAQELEKEGLTLIVAPDDLCGITTLSHKTESMNALYHKGYEDGKAIVDFLS